MKNNDEDDENSANTKQAFRTQELNMKKSMCAANKHRDATQILYLLHDYAGRL